MNFSGQKACNVIFYFQLLSSIIALMHISVIAMEPDKSLPKLLVIDDKFPVYTRDFINEEIRAIIQSKKFSVSVFSQEIVTDPNQLEKLPDWMKHNPIEQLETMPCDLDEYAIIFACWGHLGEKIAKLKHQGTYHGILITRFRGAPEERIGSTTLTCASEPSTSLCELRRTGWRRSKLQRARRADDCCYHYLKQYGDLYVPNCDFFRRELCDKFGFDDQKFIVHYESVDVHAIKQIIAESQSINVKNTNNNTISILSVCRLEPKKGLNIGLEAVARLRKKSTMPRITYTIIGEGTQRGALEKQINNLGLENIVTMAGGKNKKEVIEMLIRSDILLAPSHTSEDGDVEGIMNVLKEAGLAGTIVVATDHAGAPELIIHDKTGVLAKQDDIIDLTDKLEYAIHNFYHWSTWRDNLETAIKDHFNNACNHPHLIEIFIDALTAKNQVVKPLTSKTQKRT